MEQSPATPPAAPGGAAADRVAAWLALLAPVACALAIAVHLAQPARGRAGVTVGDLVLAGCTALWLATTLAVMYRERRAHRALRLAAEQARELAEAQRVLRRMLGLGQQIALELQPARVLQRFMEAVVDVAHADGGALGLLADDGRIRIAAAAGHGAPLLGETIPVPGSAMGRVIRSQRPWCAEDVAAAPDGSVYAPANALAPARGMAVVPLQRRGETIGAVTVVARAPRLLGAEELSRIEAMADMLSVALANAELVETLRQAEWRFRTLFRAAPDAVLTVLQSGRVREANDAARDVTGLDPVQLPGCTLADLVVPEDRTRLAEALAAAFGGAPARLEVRVARPAAPGAPAPGAPRVVALAASRLPEADPPTVLLVGRDVSGEREMRARLLETERLAAVGELVAGVAHEVNNPLSSISAFAQLLLRDGGLTAAQRDSIDVIRAETVRASQVVKDLLAFARRSAPQREPTDLNLVVERTLRLRAYELTSGRVRVEQALAPDLPAVVGDPRQLQQVILNLVTNALQAMTPAGGTLCIATRGGDGAVTLEIADTGPGIPPEVRARIFEPFFTTKPEGEGAGLGLSVSYGIVAAHGGSLAVAETSSRGTTFVLTLPAAPASAEGGAEEPPAPPPRSPLAGMRVLFVDDEPALRSSIEAFGRLRGFHVVTATDGASALAQVQTTGFDAIVCDLRMPGMDGVRFLEALRADRPGLAARVVFVTGDVLSGAGRYTPTARQPVLAKPFSLDRLEDALVAVLRGKPYGGARDGGTGGTEGRQPLLGASEP